MGKPGRDNTKGSGAAAPNGGEGLAARVMEGGLDGREIWLGIAVARFNEAITRRLLDSALVEARRLGVEGANVTVVWVPGSLELATAARALADLDAVDAVVCLGCVIRGETDHYDAVVSGARQGITLVAASTGLPVIFGVLTCENEQQALARSEAGGERDTGAYAVRAAVEMANLLKRIGP